MAKVKGIIKEEIDRIVKKYPWSDSKLLFRSELEGLAEQARKTVINEIEKMEKGNGPVVSASAMIVLEELRKVRLKK